MTTQMKAVVDQLLTGVSNALVAKGFIAEQILPTLSVGQYSGKIGKYGNDHLRIANTRQTGKQPYASVQVVTRSTDSFYIENHGLTGRVTDEDYRNAVGPFDAERDVTLSVSQIIQLDKEYNLASVLTNTSTITQNTTLSGTSQYNNRTNAASTPLEDGTIAHGTIRDATGMKANTAIMSGKVFDALRVHASLLDSLGYKDNRPGGLNEQELARALNVDRVLVGTAIYNTAAEGQTESFSPVWGKDLVYALIEQPTLMQKTLGYEVRLGGTSPRQVYKYNVPNPPNSTDIIVEDKYDQLLLNVDCAYLIKNAIA